MPDTRVLSPVWTWDDKTREHQTFKTNKRWNAYQGGRSLPWAHQSDLVYFDSLRCLHQRAQYAKTKPQTITTTLSYSAVVWSYPRCPLSAHAERKLFKGHNPFWSGNSSKCLELKRTAIYQTVVLKHVYTRKSTSIYRRQHFNHMNDNIEQLKCFLLGTMFFANTDVVGSFPVRCDSRLKPNQQTHSADKQSSRHYR